MDEAFPFALFAIFCSRFLRKAASVVTRDKDFGALVYAERLGKGVVFLRTSPATITATHNELKLLLESRSESELSDAFVVVEPGQHRFRRLT